MPSVKYRQTLGWPKGCQVQCRDALRERAPSSYQLTLICGRCRTLTKYEVNQRCVDLVPHRLGSCAVCNLSAVTGTRFGPSPQRPSGLMDDGPESLSTSV